MHFLIDSDSAIYKAGCANEQRIWYVYEEGYCVADFLYKADAKEYVEEEGLDPEAVEYIQDKTAGPLSHTIKNIDNIIKKIVDHPRCTSYQVYISGSENFRYDIDPNYKGQRDKINKPIHEEQIRQRLIKKWGAEVVDQGYETDDHVSILCYQNPDTSVIVTIDKDLDNTPGWHYNYDKEQMYFVSDEEADLHFYRQMLSGDPTDNIKGVKGIGKQRAADILPHALSTERLCKIVWDVYQDKGYDMDYFVQQGQLLWMLRKEDEYWMPPINKDLGDE